MEERLSVIFLSQSILAKASKSLKLLQKQKGVIYSKGDFMKFKKFDIITN